MPTVSAKHRRAMFAAAAGKSTLGIPQKVGQEFIAADKRKAKRKRILRRIRRNQAR